jgi:sulfite reductase (NADPH) hemoprotein beta-component
MGIDWYRDQVSAMLGFSLGKPDPNHDYGNRHLHFGWWQQPSNGLWSYGAFIENGRIADNSPNGKLKTMIRDIMNKYSIELTVTPNQDVLFTNIPGEAKEEFEADLKSYGYGQRHSKPYSQLRLLSGACVGRDTCRLTYTDSEKFEPYLIDELEQMGWGDLAESIGITGCECQCYRTATKSVGLVGSGMDRYQLKLMGTEDARHHGTPLISSDGQNMYLRSVPREKVTVVLDVLFKFYKANAEDSESLGAFHQRIGMEAIIHYFKDHPVTKELMEKPFNTDCVID